MKEIRSDFWAIADQFDVIVCTTNGILKKSGDLVMGAGIALDFSKRFPTLPRLLGQHVVEHGNTSALFLVDFNSPKAIASLPTKNHWKDPSDLDLISKSCLELVRLIETNCFNSVLLTWPGCGHGGMTPSIVRPIISPIFDERFTIASK